MEYSTGRRGRFLPLAVTAACAIAVAALGGCTGKAGSANATQAPASAAGASAGTGARGTVSRGGACNADYCDPVDCDTARATTPLAQIPPFVEPINVVIGARSSVSLADIQRALGNWKTVSTGTTVSLAGIHLRCISAEKADVGGHGYLPQQVAWRLGGCLDGNRLSLAGNEDHVRLWNQPVPGSRDGAWFAAASYETMCLAHDGGLQAASAHEIYAALHPGSAYHCVDGGPGSFHGAHPDGYDDAAADFAAAVVAAGRDRGWQVSEAAITVKRGASSGEGGVPFNDTVYVLTVTA
ncbi:MAG: hypothetical protein ACRDNS_01315 [Trebonia sp.]